MTSSLSAEDEDDPIVDEMPVYLSQKCNFHNENTFLVQYPLRPADRPYESDQDLGRIRSVRYHVNHRKLEVTHSLDTESNHYSSVANSENTLKLKSTTIRQRSNFAVGIVRNGALHLCPLTAVYQMRPDFSYLEKDLGDLESGTTAPNTDTSGFVIQDTTDWVKCSVTQSHETAEIEEAISHMTFDVSKGLNEISVENSHHFRTTYFPIGATLRNNDLSSRSVTEWVNYYLLQCSNIITLDQMIRLLRIDINNIDERYEELLNALHNTALLIRNHWIIRSEFLTDKTLKPYQKQRNTLLLLLNTFPFLIPKFVNMAVNDSLPNDILYSLLNTVTMPQLAEIRTPDPTIADPNHLKLRKRQIWVLKHDHSTTVNRQPFALPSDHFIVKQQSKMLSDLHTKVSKYYRLSALSATNEGKIILSCQFSFIDSKEQSAKPLPIPTMTPTMPLINGNSSPKVVSKTTTPMPIPKPKPILKKNVEKKSVPKESRKHSQKVTFERSNTESEEKSSPITESESKTNESSIKISLDKEHENTYQKLMSDLPKLEKKKLQTCHRFVEAKMKKQPITTLKKLHKKLIKNQSKHPSLKDMPPNYWNAAVDLVTFGVGNVRIIRVKNPEIDDYREVAIKVFMSKADGSIVSKDEIFDCWNRVLKTHPDVFVYKKILSDFCDEIQPDKWRIQNP